jgi:hypothetical protein
MFAEAMLAALLRAIRSVAATGPVTPRDVGRKVSLPLTLSLEVDAASSKAAAGAGAQSRAVERFEELAQVRSGQLPPRKNKWRLRTPKKNGIMKPRTMPPVFRPCEMACEVARAACLSTQGVTKLIRAGPKQKCAQKLLDLTSALFSDSTEAEDLQPEGSSIVAEAESAQQALLESFRAHRVANQLLGALPRTANGVSGGVICLEAMYVMSPMRNPAGNLAPVVDHLSCGSSDATMNKILCISHP